MFAERGFYGASVEEIAERAGFSKGAFYSNFETKDDLFLALLDDRVDADIRALEVLAQDSTVPAFLEFVRLRALRHDRDGQQWALLSAEFWLHAVRNQELAPKLAARQHAGRAVLARRHRGPVLPDGPPTSTTRRGFGVDEFLAVDDGLVLQEALDPAALPEDLRLRALLLFVQAISGGRPQAG